MKLSRKIFLSILAALLWAAGIGSISYALLSDTAVLSTNSIKVGTAGLLISNSQNASSTIYEEVREGFSFGLIPGSSESKYFLLKNTSGGAVDFAIDAGAVITNQNQALSAATLLHFVPVDADGNPLSGARTLSGTLIDLASNPLRIDGVVAKGATQRYKMTAELLSNYAYQNQQLDFDIIFSGTQVSN